MKTPFLNGYKSMKCVESFGRKYSKQVHGKFHRTNKILLKENI